MWSNAIRHKRCQFNIFFYSYSLCWNWVRILEFLPWFTNASAFNLFDITFSYQFNFTINVKIKNLFLTSKLCMYLYDVKKYTENKDISSIYKLSFLLWNNIIFNESYNIWIAKKNSPLADSLISYIENNFLKY